MTAVVHEPKPDVEAGGTAQPRTLVLAVMAGEGVQIDVLLDAKAPTAVMTDELVTLVDNRLRQLGEAELEAGPRGRWALCRVDGTPLRPGLALTDQNVYDGDRLWLKFVPDTERRALVIESVSTATAADLGRRFPEIDPVVAIRVGSSMLALGSVASAGLLGWWRWNHDTWVPAACASAIAVLLIAVSLAMSRQSAQHDRRDGDLLLLSSLVPLSIAATAAPPGGPASPNAVLGAGVLAVAATLALRFTGRMLGVYTALITVSVVAAGAGLARMLAMTGTVTLFTCVVLVCVVGYQTAPAVARRLAGIRLPIFPSANSRWIFDTRPELPSVVAAADCEPPSLDGPASVRNVVLKVERGRSFLTGLLGGLGLLIVVSLTTVADPSGPHGWLPYVLSGCCAGFLLLRGRSYVDRWQAITLAATAVLIVTSVAVRYGIASDAFTGLAVSAALLIVLPAAGLIAAVVVPNSIYSPLFRTVVEWVEYLCLLPIFPLALWLMNVYAAIRYR